MIQGSIDDSIGSILRKSCLGGFLLLIFLLFLVFLMFFLLQINGAIICPYLESVRRTTLLSIYMSFMNSCISGEYIMKMYY
jgi:hypothetical protein